MNTSTIHILTAFVPLLITGMALLFLAVGISRSQLKFTRTGLVLLILNGFVTTLTSAMGGASVRMTKSIPTVQDISVSYHAWTGMAAFLLSLYIAFLAFGAIRNSNLNRKRFDKLFIFVAIFLALFILTTIHAFNIRG
jgi:hypothetical protein